MFSEGKHLFFMCVALYRLHFCDKIRVCFFCLIGNLRQLSRITFSLISRIRQTLVFCSCDNFPMHIINKGRRSRNRMVIGFTSTYVISGQHRSWRGVLDISLCDQVCQLLTADQQVSMCTPDSSANKSDRHDITEISLKVVLNNNSPYPHNK